MFDSLDKRLWTKPDVTNIPGTDYLLVTNRSAGEIPAGSITYPYNDYTLLMERGFKKLSPSGKRMTTPRDFPEKLAELLALVNALKALQNSRVVYTREEPVLNWSVNGDYPKIVKTLAREYMERGYERECLDVSIAQWNRDKIKRVAHYVDPGLGGYEPRWVFPDKSMEPVIRDRVISDPQFLAFMYSCMHRRATRRRIAASITATSLGYVIYNRVRDTIRFMNDRERYKMAGSDAYTLRQTGYMSLVQRLPPEENLLVLESDDTIDRMVRKYVEAMA